MPPPMFTVSGMVLKVLNFPTGPGPRILKLFEWLLLIILKALFCVCGTEKISALHLFIITLNFHRIYLINLLIDFADLMNCLN